MTLREVCDTLEAKALSAEGKFSSEVQCVYASDLMSDVLALSTGGSLLITSAVNIHVVRTAEMAELSGICFIRGKMPEADTLELALQRGLPMMSSPLTMFEACGRLFGCLSECPSRDTCTKPCRKTYLVASGSADMTQPPVSEE